ncbi:hypothetical protein [Leptothoe sp. PORK10 BA2]|uniref:hypothetical protein n=1 Tax=Leptothoe sp. PORK10 BA2 TaxID=3110254 RepID=UPI002B1EF7AA|nr:hypothetical protein [Leptothoe sp. PORK10 BA2]MEA5463429.1 hypothetical protein [Leptothoe sp. PORK10 BA2]
MAKAILSTAIGALVASVGVIAATPQSATVQGFNGSFAPERWELFNSSPAFPGIDNSQLTINNVPLAPFNGSVDFTNAPDSLTLLGSNQSAILDQFGLSCSSPNLPVSALFLCDTSFTTVFVTVPEASIFSFNWDYTTTDSLGAAFDPFGFALGNFPPTDLRTDGVFTELIDRNGPARQSGTASVKIAANQVFGFQIGTADNQGGRAMTTISQFQVKRIDPEEPTSVPEPASVVAIALATGLGLRFSKSSRSGK